MDAVVLVVTSGVLLMVSFWNVLLVSLFALLSPKLKAASMDYLVLGVIASNEKQKGVALVKNKKSGKVAAFKEGESIKKDLIVSKVFRRTVELKWKGEMYSMEVGESAPKKFQGRDGESNGLGADLRNVNGIELEGGTLRVDRTIRDSLVNGNLNTVLMQAAAVPHTRAGRLVGFKLLGIEKGSIYDMAGLKDGDIVTHINELPINDAGYAIRALTSLKQASSARFNFLRSNQEKELVIEVN